MKYVIKRIRGGAGVLPPGGFYRLYVSGYPDRGFLRRSDAEAYRRLLRRADRASVAFRKAQAADAVASRRLYLAQVSGFARVFGDARVF